jgi:FlaG/FlaF family flagellin (archaellin)
VDCRAVSPLIGFILLMAIVMGLIGILHSTAVPQWNKAVETKHLSSLKYEVADISKAISISASTGNPAKVVLKAGVDYPNYYILFSPPKSSTTISAKNLNVNVSGSLQIEDNGSAIIVEPNYLYSSKSKLIYEHSAVLREEMNGLVLVESDQSAFSRDSIHLSIIKAKFGSFATTETASIILIPESFGGRNIFSGSIEFECYDENTARWWNETLGGIYGENNVSVDGRKVKIENLQNISLSISVFSAYALVSGEVLPPEIPKNFRLVSISPGNYQVFQGSTVTLLAKVVDDYGNPVRNAMVQIADPCNGNSNGQSDENGLVWYYFNANCIGLQRVTFSVGSHSLEFEIEVEALPAGSGGGGGTFQISWFKETNASSIQNYNWNVSMTGKQTNFYLRVLFEGNGLPNLPVYFAFNNSSIVSVNDKSISTNSTGWAFINLTANMNGSVAIVAVASDSSARLNVTITGVGPANLPPSQPSISTDKRYYRVGETITATASGSIDPNGDPITYYYRFFNLSSGSVLKDLSTDNAYTVTSNEAGHIIRVFAKACDDSNACSAESYVDVGVIKIIEIRNVTSIMDTYVRSGRPNDNYGSNETIYSGLTNQRGWGILRIFIKFNISELSGVRITNATLYLFKTGHTGTPTAIQLGAHRVHSSWSETNITWNSQPGFEAIATWSITPNTTNNLYLAWNVTSDVQLFADGTPNHGWCIKSSNEAQNTRVNFVSKESTNVNKPYLRIEYAPKVD